MATQTSEPRVTVIIPVRNGRDYIEEAIDSVLLQSLAEFEVIVIDDGSTDFDYTSLESRDRRIRVVKLTGRGVSHARNVGMRLARGEFFAFLDADDVWFPGKLEAQVRYFDAHPEVGVVFGQFLRWPPNADGSFPAAASLSVDCSQLTEAEPERSGWIYGRLLMGLLVGMNTAVIRRNIYHQIGEFNESMRIGEDYDFWLRASRMGEMHSLNGRVALYRIHSASAMHRIADENYMARLLSLAVERWGLANPDQTSLNPQDFRVRLAMTHFGHGYMHYWHGKMPVAVRSFRLAFLGGGRRFRSGIYLLLACVFSLVPWARRRNTAA